MPVAKVENNYRRQDTNTVRVAGLLIDMRLRNSASGRIAFLTIDDTTERMNVAVFADTYSEYKHVLVKDQILVIEGSVSLDERTGKPSLRAKQVARLEDVRVEQGKAVLIKLADPEVNLVAQMQATLKPYLKGKCQVHIAYSSQSAQAQFQLGPEWSVVPERELLRRLQELEGVVSTHIMY